MGLYSYKIAYISPICREAPSGRFTWNFARCVIWPT